MHTLTHDCQACIRKENNCLFVFLQTPLLSTPAPAALGTITAPAAARENASMSEEELEVNNYHKNSYGRLLS